MAVVAETAAINRHGTHNAICNSEVVQAVALNPEEMKAAVKAAIPRSLKELKYRILFPGDDVFTQTVLDTAPTNWLEALDWLRTPDWIVKSIYPQSMGSGFVYPFAEGVKPKAGIHECSGPLGIQTSKYHQENVREHTLVVVGRLAHANFGFTATCVALGVLHDIAKKYATATNAAGELSFPRHAELSAYVAGLWLFHVPELSRLVSEKDRWSIVVAIYYHMVIKDARNSGQKGDPLERIKPEIKEFFSGPGWGWQTNQSLSLIEDIDRADVGLTDQHEQCSAQVWIETTEKALGSFSRRK